MSLSICFNSDFDTTKKIMINAFPTLFPGGVGDLYDDVRGEEKNHTQWAKHLLKFHDGRFEKHKIWSLYTMNWLARKDNSCSSSFFLKRFLGDKRPTIPELKYRLSKGDTSFISKIQHYSSNIRGSPAYWRLQRQHLCTWMEYHVAQGNGPPSLFLTFSCAENHWADLADILADRVRVYNPEQADLLKQRNFKEMCSAARNHPLIVAEFFQLRVETWLKTVGKDVYKIKHHWGAYEFAKGRGMIHIHLLAICDNLETLKEYYDARTNAKKQLEIITKYAREELFMTAEHPTGEMNDIASPEGNAKKETYLHSLQKRFCEVECIIRDLVNVINSAMMHYCNNYCLRLPYNGKFSNDKDK